MGSSQVINLSSPSRNLLKACACVRNMFKTASEVLQVSSRAANGWVSRRFLVTLWYSVEAVFNMVVKLLVEEPAVWDLADIE